MRLDKFTVKAQEALATAQEQATASGHPQITPLHLLAALVREANGGAIVPILEKVGAPVGRIRQICQVELDRLPKAQGGQTVPDPALQQVLEAAQKEADRLKDQYVSTEHLLLALADVASDARETLTQREREILKLIAEGHKNKEIADYLFISLKTVEKHRANLMKKLGLHNAAALTAYALERGLLDK